MAGPRATRREPRADEREASSLGVEVPDLESPSARYGAGPARWLRETSGIEPVQVRMPLGEFLLEAAQVAALMDEQVRRASEDGASTGDGDSTVNLRELMRMSGLSVEVGAEMRDLAAAIQELDGRVSSIANQSENAEMDRALSDRATLNRALSFLFDATDNENGKVVLRRLRRQSRERTQSAVASSLMTYSQLACQYADELVSLGVERRVFDEAPGVSIALRERRSRGSLSRAERKDLVSARNHLCGLLTQKVKKARSVLRFALRDEPELLAQVASNYARKRQRRYQQRKSQSRGE